MGRSLSSAKSVSSFSDRRRRNRVSKSTDSEPPSTHSIVASPLATCHGVVMVMVMVAVNICTPRMRTYPAQPPATRHYTHTRQAYLRVLGVHEGSHEHHHVRPRRPHRPQQVVQRLVHEAVARRERARGGEDGERLPAGELRPVLDAEEVRGPRGRERSRYSVDDPTGHHAAAGAVDALDGHDLAREEGEGLELP